MAKLPSASAVIPYPYELPLDGATATQRVLPVVPFILATVRSFQVPPGTTAAPAKVLASVEPTTAMSLAESTATPYTEPLPNVQAPEKPLPSLDVVASARVKAMTRQKPRSFPDHMSAGMLAGVDAARAPPAWGRGRGDAQGAQRLASLQGRAVQTKQLCQCTLQLVGFRKHFRSRPRSGHPPSPLTATDLHVAPGTTRPGEARLCPQTLAGPSASISGLPQYVQAPKGTPMYCIHIQVQHSIHVRTTGSPPVCVKVREVHNFLFRRLL